jgi:hypothetical protein
MMQQNGNFQCDPARRQLAARNNFLLGRTLLACCALVTTGLLVYRLTTVSGPAAGRPFTRAALKPIPLSDGKTQLQLIFQGNSTAVVTQSMSHKEADSNFFNFVSYLHYHCEDYIRLGNSFDGGWDMCVVGPYQPTRHHCLIYSFGISWDFSFDDAASIKLGCTIRAFDPSMTDTPDHRRGPNIWFYQVGIGGQDSDMDSRGWKLRTLDSLIRDCNDTTRTIDYLKMDIEDAEWETLINMGSTGVLDRVKQLALEIHVVAKTFYKYYSVLKQLEERGFRRWYWAMNFRGDNIYMDRNGARSYGYEMVYINTRYLDHPMR